MKWGTLYSADYVNVLYSAVKKQLTGDFRFVCLTNDPEGLVPGIQTHPIPEFGLSEIHWRKGAWPKLSVFSEELYGLSGRALFIDLDMMIVGPLDEFFTFADGLVTIDEGVWQNAPPSAMTSIFAFDIGQHADALEKFKSELDLMTTKYRTDQDYLHHEGPEITYWPNDWLVSFKRHLRQPVLLDRFVDPKPPPPQTRVLVFHGEPRPIDLIRKSNSNVVRFPHYLTGPVDWARKYWVDNGGPP